MIYERDNFFNRKIPVNYSVIVSNLFNESYCDSFLPSFSLFYQWKSRVELTFVPSFWGVGELIY